ncbi:MAG TPA: peptide-methionine (S)-S-oxide reductase MsrA [Patescibacteria group bacterium]|nr:peptide-methionine (S)-S-oxide reductase MsrA [Patescibacteria group bacterium]
MNPHEQVATFANGCFWCTEAVFKRVKGISSVVSGFSGGKRENPTYDQVATGATGHAECIQVVFDPSIISYETLLDIFFATHDPTTLNQQGYDVGEEYRSAIFYHTEEQKKTAEEKIKKLNKSEKYSDPLVTELTPFTNFYPAGSEHQNFYESGKRPDYCRVIIDPKIQKLFKEFAKEVKEKYK